MVFFHDQIMDWLVTDERYLNHMHDEETVIAEEYNGPQYSGQELSKKYRLTDPCKWRIEHVNQTDSTHCEVQV